MTEKDYISVEYFPLGRLGNQLYLALQIYKKSIQTKKKFKYTTTKLFDEKFPDICKLAGFFNLEEFVCSDHVVLDQRIQMNNSYFQYIGRDFIEDQLDSFLRKTILDSSEFKRQISSRSDKDVAIHIRAGDFINIKDTQCFDKKRYVERSLQLIPRTSDECWIFSEANNSFSSEFDDILLGRFRKIHHVSSTPEADLVALGSFKNLILWNSTFSYWAGYISSAFYNSINIVCVPERYTKDISSRTRGKISWNYIYD